MARSQRSVVAVLSFVCAAGAFMAPHAIRPPRGLFASPADGERWFVKTEQFCKPFPEVKPFLEAHRTWVKQLREGGAVITSGYRVDKHGKPGGGGMMFFAAQDYEAAEALVRQDPLVANDCVDWRLNGWIAEVGEVEVC